MPEVFGLGYSSRFAAFLGDLVPQQRRAEQKMNGSIWGAPVSEMVYDPTELSVAISNLAKERILEILQDEGPAKIKLSLTSGKLHIENAHKNLPQAEVSSVETILASIDTFAQTEAARIERRIVDKAKAQDKERLGLGSGDRVEAWNSL